MYMHDRGYVHRDLKAENILIRDKMKGDSDDSEPFIKVVDFGMSKHVRGVRARSARISTISLIHFNAHSLSILPEYQLSRITLSLNAHSFAIIPFEYNNVIRIRTLNLRFALEHRYNLRLQTVCSEHLAIRLPNV